jgi:nucleoside-diphosphate-sugar epimerase
MKILITGGAGFVGPNLIKKFLNKRYSVFCIDNYSRGCEVNIKSFFNNNNFKFLKCDLSDYD